MEGGKEKGSKERKEEKSERRNHENIHGGEERLSGEESAGVYILSHILGLLGLFPTAVTAMLFFHTTADSRSS